MKQGLGKGYLRLFVRAAVFLLVLYLVFTRSPFSGAGDGNGDVPSLKDGDLALGYRLEREYRTGDVIVYEAGGALHFGRVAVKEEENTDEETLSVQQDYQTDPEDSTDGDEVSRKQVRGRIITILRRRGPVREKSSK